MSHNVETPAGSLERAIAIAASAHAGQTDKGDAPYILHPLRVMLRLTNRRAQIAAVLHDVIEDGDGWSVGRLADEGFSQEVIDAVRAVTRRPDEEAPEGAGADETPRGRRDASGSAGNGPINLQGPGCSRSARRGAGQLARAIQVAGYG